jgi:hypothetical protein
MVPNQWWGLGLLLSHCAGPLFTSWCSPGLWLLG